MASFILVGLLLLSSSVVHATCSIEESLVNFPRHTSQLMRKGFSDNKVGNGWSVMVRVTNNTTRTHNFVTSLLSCGFGSQVLPGKSRSKWCTVDEVSEFGDYVATQRGYGSSSELVFSGRICQSLD